MSPSLKHKSLDLMARVCLAAIFVISVPVKLSNFASVVNSIVGRGIPEPIAIFLLIAAIACIAVGSFLLILGKNQAFGAALLLIFLVPTTIIFHLFPFQLQRVFMNLGLIGGLTLVLTRERQIKEIS